MSGTGELRSSQGRMAVLAVATSLLLLAATAFGAEHAIAYVVPVVALFVLLLLGVYPGADAYARALRRASAPPRRPRSTRIGRRFRPALPRGGALLAASLAGRAPPRLLR